MEANHVSMHEATDLASVGRASVLAELLSADQQLAAAIADWNAQLVGTASDLAITLEARDVRTLLPRPIAALQDVLTWVQPRVLLNYGALDPAAVRALARWCEYAAVCVAALLSVRYRVPTDPAAIATQAAHLPTAIPLTIYQRSTLGAFLQVGDDIVTILGRLLHLAQAPRAPVFTSSLRHADCACGQAACAGLRELLLCAQPWVGGTPALRGCFLVREQLREARTMLMLVLEATPDRRRRQALADLLAGLSDLWRHVLHTDAAQGVSWVIR
jgi:hypothetical protein